MFKKLAIISFAFFILAGNFSNFAFFNLIPVDISIISMVIPGLYFVFWSLKNMSLHKTSFPLIAFFISLIPVIFYMNSTADKLIMFLMMFFILSILSPVLLSDKSSIKLFIKSLFITSIAIVAMALAGLDNIHVPTGRLTIDGGNPIWLARAVSIAAFMLIILLLNNKIGLWKFILFFVPTFFILISTGSRGPLLAMGIALFIIYFSNIKSFLLNKKTLFNSFSILVFSIPIGLIIYTVSPDPFDRLFDFSPASTDSARLFLYQDAVNVIKNNPMGVGLGNFENHSFFKYPHNLILEAFSELGWVPGLLLILMIIISFIGLKQLAKGDIAGGILLGIFIMAFINSMISGDLTSPKELYLLIPIGLNHFELKKRVKLKQLNTNLEKTSS